MRFTLAASVVSLVISAGALTVTQPEKGADIAPSSSVDVKWTSVDTDAKSFDIYLVNNAVYPSVNKKLASDISTSDGSHTVDIGNLADGQGYQINLMSDATENTGILAQTGQFNITGSASKSSTTSSGSTTSTTSTASGTTLTGTNTATTAASGLQTSASSTTNSTTAATSTHSTGAAFTLAANPAAAIGVIGGALALML
ncbi:hypothetical protein N7454_006725 [Penicillium verhagenii]|nr:hypothetical protein N7454_006725 [Penicillium verhagenii]